MERKRAKQRYYNKLASVIMNESDSADDNSDINACHTAQNSEMTNSQFSSNINNVCCPTDDSLLSDEGCLLSYSSYAHCSADTYLGAQGNDTSADEDDTSAAPIHDWLRDWAVEYHVPHNALNALLGCLSQTYSDLPTDARTLLKTSRIIDVTEVDSGHFCYFGIEKGLKEIDEKKGGIPEQVKLTINFDGLKLTRSSKMSFWPILATVDGFSLVFIIGSYVGTSKPSDLEKYLQQLLHEVKSLSEDGFICNGKKVHVTIRKVIMDAPAKALMKGTKLCTGYSGCDKCKQEGEWLNGRIVYPALHFQKRTDLDFRMQSDVDHHKMYTPLCEVRSLDMVRDFPIDYMHQVCLGVVRKMLYAFLSGPLSVRLPSASINQISHSLLTLKKFIPHDFSRKNRTLDDIDNWKATEFRLFLLYTGPVVLKGVLDETLYSHFLVLHVAITLLVDEAYVAKEEILSYVGELLVEFVREFGCLYGKVSMVYNVHSLLHICDDVRAFGKLDDFSGFPFETSMHFIKRHVRSGNLPLQQLAKRVSESGQIMNESRETCRMGPCGSHADGPVLPNISCLQYQKFVMPSTCISIFQGNNVCQMKEDIILVQNVLEVKNKIYFLAQKFEIKEQFFIHPCDSSKIGVFVVSKLSDLKLFDVQQFSCKCVLFPFQEKSAIFPLRNTKPFGTEM